MSDGSSFSITTPIFYVNDVPHIGHAYTEVAADFLARWHRQRGDDTWLLTGTDEHGQKILRSAVANDMTPREWADRLVETAWLPLLNTLDVANDDFIRTTDERHERGVTAFLQKLYDDGYIYSGDFEGFYCVGCEEYKQPSDLVAGTGPYEGQQVCAIHSIPVEVLSERNYFFRMSDFQQRLLDLYESNPQFIQPESVRNEVIRFVSQGLRDLSISRSTFDWGIKLPWDDEQVLYVWFDALLNYITALGYGSDDDEAFRRLWPSVHVIGKDIARFHAVIWPAMLMAADVPVPERVFGHGWLLVGGEKMSKSKGTGIVPVEITERFGSDAFRYYFLRAFVFGSDGSFSWEDISNRYHAELANGYGNLASRIIAMLLRYFDGAVPARGALTDSDTAIDELAERVTGRADEAMLALQPHLAIAAAYELVEALNGYITEQQPWVLAKDDAQRERLGTVLTTALRGLGTVSVLFSPVMPKATETLWASIGAGGSIADQRVDRAWEWQAATTVSPLENGLFPRVEQPEQGAA
ncbi:MAG: methionine--tRNA ligase [Curtobacterium sp.]|uniref:methionine--tRNA ligase n=1 Tax=Curtobacterium sp. Curtsp57 TaxID=3243047 RepID=UPI0031A0AAA5